MRALFHLSANFETDTESIDDVCREICFRRLMQVMNSIFVKRTIPKSSRAKQEVTDLFDAIKEAFSIKISNMVWLDNSTREIALERVTIGRNSLKAHAFSEVHDQVENHEHF